MAALDDTLRALTSYRLRRTTSAAMSRMAKVFAKFGLRSTTYATLSVVVETPGQRQGKVAEALAIERPNFVHIVDELEKAGLLARETAADDKRAYALRPTDAGTRLYQAMAQEVRACDQALTQGLSARQIADLHAALEVISENSSGLED